MAKHYIHSTCGQSMVFNITEPRKLGDSEQNTNVIGKISIGGGAWVNGGFFVCEPGVFDYIPDGENAIWEREPLMRLAREGQLNAYKHSGFWHPMDTLKDKLELNDLWAKRQAPWKVWSD